MSRQPTQPPEFWAKAEGLDGVRDFLRWLIRLDDARDPQGVEDRRLVTLNQIITYARSLEPRLDKAAPPPAPTPPLESGRGKCTECGGSFVVKKDGTLRWHGDGSFPPGMCQGAGELPVKPDPAPVYDTPETVEAKFKQAAMIMNAAKHAVSGASGTSGVTR